MSSSFFVGLSGLSANSAALGVIGNNLANLNTTAFKTSVVSFQDLLQSSMARNGLGNPMQAGMGVVLGGITPVFSQGSLQSTSQSTDMAIVGNGFFVLSDGQRSLYSRAGNFSMDSQGFLRTQQGLFVQGRQAVNGVVSEGGLGNLQISPGMSVPPNATTKIALDLNLDAGAKNDATFSSTIDVFDSLGGSHTLTITFTKDSAAANQWKYSITVPGSDVGSTKTTEEITNGSVTFDDKGKLKSPAKNVTKLKVAGLVNGAADITFDWEVLDSAGVPRLSQFAGPSNTSGATQDGFSQGTLLGFQVDSAGLIQGTFSNGQQQALGQIVLANFNNPQGLANLGQNTFTESSSSGEPILGSPQTGGRGTLLGNALELSNVDIAQEFTNMILAQRGYQASSRIITTTDEIIQEAIALKR